MCELEAVVPTPIRVTGRAASIQFRVRIAENETDLDARLLFDQQMFVPVLSRENPLTFHIKKATIFGDYLEIWAICARPLRPCEIDFFRLVEDGQSAAFNLLRQVDLEARAITAFQRVASDLRNRSRFARRLIICRLSCIIVIAGGVIIVVRVSDITTLLCFERKVADRVCQGDDLTCRQLQRDAVRSTGGPRIKGAGQFQDGPAIDFRNIVLRNQLAGAVHKLAFKLRFRRENDFAGVVIDFPGQLCRSRFLAKFVLG